MNTNRNEGVKHPTEDKFWWLRHGEDLERDFVALCRTRFSMKVEINPSKLIDPLAPDLLVNGSIADLKTQNTPFFTAARYQLNPQYTVTFNRKDYERYRSRYPEIVIFYWVDWQQTTWRSFSVPHLAGIYSLPFSQISSMIDRGAPEHRYVHRRDDTLGNAKSSFLLDLRLFKDIAIDNLHNNGAL